MFAHPRNDVVALNTMKPFGGRVCLTLCKIALMMLPPHPAHPHDHRHFISQDMVASRQLLWFHLSNSSSGLDVEKVWNGVVSVCVLVGGDKSR